MRQSAGPQRIEKVKEPEPVAPKPEESLAESARMFEDAKAVPKDCLILIYDFENFTGFLSVPDIHRDVARYLNFVDGHLRCLFTGGPVVGLQGRKALTTLGFKVLHEKFLGDGVMFIAEFTSDDKKKRSDTARALCTRALHLKNNFNLINNEAMKFMPVADVPQRIRFGLTYGTVLELSRTDGGKEYVGFAINLAARLQKYAGKASFLASARLPYADEWMEKYDFVKVKATALRGRPNEFVYIDKKDLAQALLSDDEKELFEVAAKVDE